jgi:hypothetical protein
LSRLELDNAREPVAFIMERLPLTAAAVQCLLLSNNGQIVAVPRMSALCQKRTHAPQQTAIRSPRRRWQAAWAGRSRVSTAVLRQRYRRAVFANKSTTEIQNRLRRPAIDA